MKTTKTTTIILIAVAAMLLLSGCTDWKKKYSALTVEHENLKGLYENCQSGAGQAVGMADELAGCRSEVSDLASQLEECSNIAKDTGFEGMDQSYDPMTGDITVVLPNEILFDSGKVKLKKNIVGQLDKVVSVLQQRYASNQVDVVGHTDTDPIKKSKWADNWQLGSERALAVTRYLQKRGIQASALRSISCGEYRPVSSSKSKNRRVEIVVHTR